MNFTSCGLEAVRRAADVAAPARTALTRQLPPPAGVAHLDFISVAAEGSWVASWSRWLASLGEGCCRRNGSCGGSNGGQDKGGEVHGGY
jgi:hypothetical protein